MATLTFEDGTKIEGTPDELRAIVQNLKDGHGKFNNSDYYYSESKGEWLLIEDMATKHIRDAILKIYRKELDRIQHADLDNEEFVMAIDYLYTNDLISKLQNELEHREDE